MSTETAPEGITPDLIKDVVWERFDISPVDEANVVANEKLVRARKLGVYLVHKWFGRDTRLLMERLFKIRRGTIETYIHQGQKTWEDVSDEMFCKDVVEVESQLGLESTRPGKKNILEKIFRGVGELCLRKGFNFLNDPCNWGGSPLMFLLKCSRIISAFGLLFAFVALLVMGRVGEGFKCLGACFLGRVLYNRGLKIANFLFTPTLKMGSVNDSVLKRQVFVTIIWRVYFLFILAFWCDITIWAYFKEPINEYNVMLRIVYLIICITIPGLVIITQSGLLRQMAFAGSKMAEAMYVGYEVTFFAHVLACYAAYSGERMLAVLCVIPLIQFLAFVVTTTNPREQAEGIVHELRQAVAAKEAEANSTTDTIDETVSEPK